MQIGKCKIRAATEKYYIFKRVNTKYMEIYNGKDVSKFNKKGNATEVLSYDAKGRLASREISRYDRKGNEVEWVMYDKGCVFSRINFKNDGYGNVTEAAKYNADGDLESKTIHRNKYDKNRNRVEHFHSDGSGFKHRYIYKYDNMNNLQEKLYYFGKRLRLSSKHIYEHDEAGNTIEYIYKPNGNLSDKHVYKYEGEWLIEDTHYKVKNKREIPCLQTLYEYR